MNSISTTLLGFHPQPSSLCHHENPRDWGTQNVPRIKAKRVTFFHNLMVSGTNCNSTPSAQSKARREPGRPLARVTSWEDMAEEESMEEIQLKDGLAPAAQCTVASPPAMNAWERVGRNTAMGGASLPTSTSYCCRVWCPHCCPAGVHTVVAAMRSTLICFRVLHSCPQQQCHRLVSSPAACCMLALQLLLQSLGLWNLRIISSKRPANLTYVLHR